MVPERAPLSTLPMSTRWSSRGEVDSHRLSVAPMLDCTDTHFRRLCRLLSRRVHLWTEMINQDAIIYSHKEKPTLLSYGEGGALHLFFHPVYSNHSSAGINN